MMQATSSDATSLVHSKYKQVDLQCRIYILILLSLHTSTQHSFHTYPLAFLAALRSAREVAWYPLRMGATVRTDPQSLQCKKYRPNPESRSRVVLGERHISQVTYSTTYFLNRTFNVLWNILATNHKTLIAINTAFGTQLGHEELKDVFGRTLHHGTNFLKVDPQRLFRPHESELRWFNVATLLFHQIGIVGLQELTTRSNSSS